jgi:hypothetical protein
MWSMDPHLTIRIVDLSFLNLQVVWLLLFADTVFLVLRKNKGN